MKNISYIILSRHAAYEHIISINDGIANIQLSMFIKKDFRPLMPYNLVDSVKVSIIGEDRVPVNNNGLCEFINNHRTLVDVLKLSIYLK